MKKNTYSVMGLVQKAIIDCMNFSKRGKNEIFIDVSPHVDVIHFYAYQGGWSITKERVFDLHIYTRGNLAPSVKDAKKILKPIYDFIKQNSNIA